MNTEERTIWRGSSSHVVNFWTHLAGGLLFWLVVPLAFSIWKVIENRHRVYEVTTQRIRLIAGVLSRTTDELELYRVNDITLVEPFLQRLFGAGTIVLLTGDQTSATFRIEAVKGAHALREEIRKHVEECRERKRVRVTEFEN